MEAVRPQFEQPKLAADGRTAIPRVKICGITNERDALDAIALGADALGFNLYPKSKRFIDLEKEAGWIESLPPGIAKVAVMVNPSLEEAGAVSSLPFIDLVQFHGDEDAEYCAGFARLGRPFIKAIAAKDASSLQELAKFQTPLLLLDAYQPGEYGGTGRTIDREVLPVPGSLGDLKIILAGGLNPANVRDFVDRLRPHAVDVASGVESAPGQKDKARMEQFIRAAAGNS